MQVHKLLVDTAPPVLTSKSWAVLDGRTGDILFGKNQNERRQFASVTKVMTAFVVLQVIRKIKLDPKKTLLQTSRFAASIIGTSARLRNGDILSVWDLLHGLMLPSGNDAATSLAQHFGQYFYEVSAKFRSAGGASGVGASGAAGQNGNQRPIATDPIKYFLYQMNRYARALGLYSTNYANPHGLGHKNNKSTAADQGKLSAIAMQDPLFRDIVNKKIYTCTVLDYAQNQKVFTWKNTNKLLGKGFNGIKTGITPSAGPCLAASYEKNDLHLIIVIIAAKTVDHRFVEVPRLALWTINRLNRLTEYYASLMGAKGRPLEFKKLAAPAPNEVGLDENKEKEEND